MAGRRWIEAGRRVCGNLDRRTDTRCGAGESRSGFVHPRLVERLKGDGNDPPAPRRVMAAESPPLFS